MNIFFSRIKLFSLVLPVGAGLLALSGCHNNCDECNACQDGGHKRASAYAEKVDATGVAFEHSSHTPKRKEVVESNDGSVSVQNRREPIARHNAGDGKLERALMPLAFLTGSWTVEMRKSATATAPLPANAHGTFRFTPALDGSGLTGELELQGENKYNYQEELVLIAAKQEQAAQPQNTSADNDKFIVSMSNSMGKTSVDKNASFDGTHLVVLSEEKHGGKTINARATYTKISNERVDFSLETNSTGTFVKEFESTLTRSSELPAVRKI